MLRGACPIIARYTAVERAPPAAGRRRQLPDPPIRADQVDHAPPVVSVACGSRKSAFHPPGASFLAAPRHTGQHSSA